MENQKLIQNPTLVFREEFDDYALLFDPDTGDAFALGPVSAFIWKRLDGRHTAEDILKEMPSEFEEVPDDAEALGDINGFIKKLLDEGFAGYEFGK